MAKLTAETAEQFRKDRIEAELGMRQMAGLAQVAPSQCAMVEQSEDVEDYILERVQYAHERYVQPILKGQSNQQFIAAIDETLGARIDWRPIEEVPMEPGIKIIGWVAGAPLQLMRDETCNWVDLDEIAVYEPSHYAHGGIPGPEVAS